MAFADYRLCDKCEGKAFYDANLNYEWPRKEGGHWEGGHWVNPENAVRDSDWALDYLGDWAVLCIDCAKTHRCVIVPIENQEA